MQPSRLYRLRGDLLRMNHVKERVVQMQGEINNHTLTPVELEGVTPVVESSVGEMSLHAHGNKERS